MNYAFLKVVHTSPLWAGQCIVLFCQPSWLPASIFPQMASATDARYGQKESSDQNFDYMFKILIIGNSSVGKTSFLFRYADDSFTPAFVSTVGIDFKVKTIYRNDKRIKLQIWVRSCVGWDWPTWQVCFKKLYQNNIPTLYFPRMTELYVKEHSYHSNQGQGFSKGFPVRLTFQ